MKIRPAGTELFHADRQKYMTSLIATFRNSVNAPSNKLCARTNSCSVFFLIPAFRIADLFYENAKLPQLGERASWMIIEPGTCIVIKKPTRP